VAKRKKQSDMEALIMLVATLMAASIALIIRLIIFIYDVVSFKKTKYKEKSGQAFFKMYFNKGYYGEFILYRKLCKLFENKQVMTNLYLDGKNTTETEIDVLVVSTKGVYVFEMKNYGGYIFGSEQDKHWKQVMNRFSKHNFYNPLRQNYAHTKAVESFLQIDIEHITPMVVFSNRSKLSKINVSKKHFVAHLNQAIKVVKEKEKYGKSIFTKEDLTQMINKLTLRQNQSDEVKSLHVLEVENLIKEEIKVTE